MTSNNIKMGTGTTQTECITRDAYPTAVQIKKAIPAHCFKSDLIQSLYYAIKDVTIILILHFVMLYLEKALPLRVLIILWPVFWFIQGTMFTAIFVVGHDCGHSSFSKYDFVNDVLGTICHTFLLTPFYPWKLSHRNHHQNTGNIDKDEVFYPTRKCNGDGSGYMRWFGLGFGWISYLIKGYSPRRVYHFNPYCTMYSNHVTGCTISIISVVAWIAALYMSAGYFGAFNIVKYYVIPEFIFTCWIVIVTFLHHTDVNVPWYSDKKWTFVKGQLSSIDRHYGWAHEIIHNIGTHQIHHLFTKVPHYHLEEATAYFRKAFPELVRVKDHAILPAFHRIFNKFTEQNLVADDADIHVFQ